MKGKAVSPNQGHHAAGEEDLTSIQTIGQRCCKRSNDCKTEEKGGIYPARILP